MCIFMTCHFHQLSAPQWLRSRSAHIRLCPHCHQNPERKNKTKNTVLKKTKKPHTVSEVSKFRNFFFKKKKPKVLNVKVFPPTPQEKLGRFAQIPSVIQIPLEITNKKKKNMENFNFMFLTLIWKKVGRVCQSAKQ